MGITIDITGTDEIIKDLKKLSPDIQTKIARKATLKAAGVIRKEAKKRAPKDTGTLRKGIRSRFVKPGSSLWRGLPVKQRRDFTAYVTGVFHSSGSIGKAWYGRLVEFGTKAHTIPRPGKTSRVKNRNKKVLLVGKGGEVFGSSVKHPGTAPRPWLEPALKSSAKDATKASDQALKDWLKKWKRGKFK